MVKMLILVVSVYTICYFPINILWVSLTEWFIEQTRLCKSSMGEKREVRKEGERDRQTDRETEREEEGRKDREEIEREIGGREEG